MYDTAFRNTHMKYYSSSGDILDSLNFGEIVICKGVKNMVKEKVPSMMMSSVRDYVVGFNKSIRVTDTNHIVDFSHPKYQQSIDNLTEQCIDAGINIEPF